VWHEVINDRIGREEVAVTFCPLCGTAMVFDRTIGGKVLEFKVSGKLYESNLLMYDTETESLWSQAKSEAVVGAYTGTKLVLRDMSVLSFGVAKKKFPQMRVLSRETGYERDYSFYPYGQYNEQEETLFPISVLSTRFPAKTIMYSFSIQGVSVAFPRAELKEGVLEENIEGIQLRIERQGEEIQIFADGKKIPGYHEMWFSWAIHHEKTGVVLDVQKMTNRLSEESSLYLRSHQENPVEWYPWGEGAFQRAKKESKLIFLSIGYATCHWCHVMARESFEDKEVAAYLNAHYVNIKVDREEYPDVDQCYMKVCQMLTGSGGWPMSLILTPERTPVFAGTYFPKEGYGDIPGFLEVMSFIQKQWEEKREEMEGLGKKLIQVLGQHSGRKGEQRKEEEMVEMFFEGVDEVYGGFGYGPKFPLWTHLQGLLALGREKGREVVDRAMQAIAAGGIYDHVGGGVHRYTIDAEWHTPHFEKMLYDQAQFLLLIGTIGKKKRQRSTEK
jgi:thioredoxin-related protein